MSLDYVKFTPGFDAFMPKEYKDMVEHGPFGKKTTVSQMGSFKEILEEHPMCAGCAMTLFIRLAIIAFPESRRHYHGRHGRMRPVSHFAGGNSLRVRQLRRPERRRQRIVARVADSLRRQTQGCRGDRG